MANIKEVSDYERYLFLNGLEDGFEQKINEYIKGDQFTSVVPRHLLRVIERYYKKEYSTVLELIEKIPVPEIYHEQMRMIWSKTHYSITKRRTKKELSSSQEDRIRIRYPFPKLVREGFNKQNRDELSESFTRNRYLSPSELERLVNVTKLTKSQIKNFFGNARHRKSKNFKRGSEKETKLPEKDVSYDFKNHLNFCNQMEPLRLGYQKNNQFNNEENCTHIRENSGQFREDNGNIYTIL